MTYQSPKYSFVQFAIPEFTLSGFKFPDSDIELPVANVDDIAFQILVTGTDPEIDAFIEDNHQVFIAAKTGPNLLNIASSNYEVVRLSSTTALFIFNGELTNFKTVVANYECFRIGISFIISGGTTIYFSNIFQRLDKTRYTTVLEYRALENSNGFIYCNANVVNRARLPILLSEPQINDDEEIYMKSNGQRKILKSISSKEYKGSTDLFKFSVHEKLKIALSSDEVVADGYHYQGEIVKNGNYEIDWTEYEELEKAKAKFKVFASPYRVYNSNCENCPPAYVPECIAVSLPPDSYIMPEAIEGQPYSHSITLIGTAPFVIAEYDGPDWLTVEIVGSELHFSGTAEDVSNGFLVRVTNCEDEEAMLESSIVMGECIPITLEEFSLEDAIVGVPYSQTIPLSGSPAFTGSNFTFPWPWLEWEIVGSNLLLTGTPESLEQIGTLSIDIENCGDTINLVTEINVVEPNDDGITVDNQSIAETTIVSINPEFYTIVLGAIPVTPMNSAGGFHSGYSGVISVEIDNALGSEELILQKNLSTIETLPVTTNGTYNFSSFSFSPTDKIKIILN